MIRQAGHHIGEGIIETDEVVFRHDTDFERRTGICSNCGMGSFEEPILLTRKQQLCLACHAEAQPALIRFGEASPQYLAALERVVRSVEEGF
jgi:hypothetical protein